MRKVIAVGILLMLNQFVRAQQFEEKFSITLPDSITSAKVEWVDLDNDGLLDLLIPSKSQSQSYFLFAKGDTVATPVLQSNVQKIIDFEYYQVVDFNRDNAMDVIVSGLKNNLPVIIAYLNNGDFTFAEQVLSVPAFSMSKFVDLDDDAKVEWIISGTNNGEGFVNIFRETAAGWTLVHDSLKFTLTALETFDADGDGTHDLFISGSDETDSLFTGFLINHGGFYFKSWLAKSWQGSTTVSDLNNDGTFDVVFCGTDEIGNKVNKIFQSQGNTFEMKDEPLALQVLSVFAADLNSDGVVDYNYFGTNIVNDSVNIIRYGMNSYDTLVSHKVTVQRFGDLEHDGDLDVVQVVNEPSLRLQVLENNAAENIAPGQPTNGIALPVFNRLFMHWNKPIDDHTPLSSITFDVALTSQGNELQGGEFDLFNAKRLGASHGNNRTQNFRLVKKPTVAFGYYIQAVDNSLHAGNDKLPLDGLCIGNGATPCGPTVEAEQLVVCEDEIKTLTAPNESLWFSFADGYLGMHSTYDFQSSKGDTVFYFNPSVSVCDALKVWTVRIKNDTIKKEFNTVYACEGSTLEFKAETDWDELQWTSDQKGDLGTAFIIQYPVTQADSIFLDVSSESGCIISRRTAVLISKPVVEVSADRYKIMKGSEVQLTATGAERYTWIPATGLSQTNISNPVASPIMTTEYTVTGYDSINCSDDATVTIIVEDTGFIPNLFTPNDDGTNDELKVYGLSSANDFSLRIYNREGSLVFKTDNVSDAVQQGWNGFTNGVRQPSGVYFWKVKGSLPSGEKLLLNGKESGSIVLVR